MSTIATTTNATPFQYPGVTLAARCANENIYIALVKATTADTYVMYKSSDSGGSWASLISITRTNLVDVGDIWLDRYGWLWWTYRTNESSQDRVYLRVINSHDGASGNSPEVLLGSADNGAVAGAYYSGVSVATFYNGATHYIAAAVGTNIGSTQGVTLLGATTGHSGDMTLSANNAIISGTRQWLHAGTAGRVGPSIDTEHNGNGYDGAGNLWVTYGRSHLKLVKLSWTGSGWVGSTGETTVYANVGSPNQVTGIWDGARLMMCVPDPVNTSQVALWERNRANSATVTRRSQTHPTGVVRNATMAYDPNTGNIRVWAVGTSTAVLYVCDFTRGSNTFSSWATTGLTILGAAADNWGAKRSSYADARWGLYTAASGAPNTLTYTAAALTYSPNTPTWVSPASGAAADVAVGLTLTWAFSDNDPGDTQGSYAVSKQVGAGALSYWRASDSTWQVAEVQNSSSTTAITVPSSWAVHTDAMHTFKAKVWDSGGLASGYSAGLMVLPSTPINPVITSPTAAQVLGTDHVTVVWTATEQTQFRVILAVTAGAQVYDSGWVGDSASRSYLIPYTMPTGGNYTITLQTANNEGLPSAAVTRQFTTNFTPPMTPTYVVTPMPTLGIIRVAITNPTPGGGAPAVASQDLYRRTVGDSSVGVRVGTLLLNAAVVDDFRAVSGTSYEYRVLTIGTTGVSQYGAWTA